MSYFSIHLNTSTSIFHSHLITYFLGKLPAAAVAKVYITPTTFYNVVTQSGVWGFLETDVVYKGIALFTCGVQSNCIIIYTRNWETIWINNWSNLQCLINDTPIFGNVRLNTGQVLFTNCHKFPGNDFYLDFVVTIASYV